MAQDILTDTQLLREQRRLRLALAAGRMCALDYLISEDRLELWPDGGAACAGFEQLNGSLAQLLAHVHAEDRAGVERAVGQAIARGSELEFEARLSLGPPHRTSWLLVEAAVERDALGRAVRIVGVARDNTARREGQAVRRAQAQGERLRALGEMASGIAHDLNQSLALITGYSDMARQELNLETPDLLRVREMVEITARAALEGGHALRGLLTFVRSQELMAEAERLDIQELLNDAARLTAPRWRDAPQVEGRPIHLTVDAQADLAVTGSAAALREAITNLIFNAVDALPHGGSIQLKAWRQDERVMIEVRDSGTGIPLDIQARIFDPFFTTKGERGTGLGLPQVLSIVERHMGSIDVESNPRRGTAFLISLPVSEETAPPAGARAAERAPETACRCIRVLVVEDEDQLARMASLVLKQRGHVVNVASSGDAALTLLDAQAPFDLVISDLGLGPGKNGWDLAEAVRQRWPATRFVLVTGWGAAIDLAEARLRGVDRIIAKPYRIAELRQVADEVAAAGANE
jgi:signal transduction histidine kinase/ActR/RegA family two-component response regulator